MKVAASMGSTGSASKDDRLQRVGDTEGQMLNIVYYATCDVASWNWPV